MSKLLRLAMAGCVIFALWGCDDEPGPDDCEDVENRCEEAGQVRCSAANDAVEECVERTDGCLAWTETESCGDHQQCDAEGDAPTCVCENECDDGATRCDGDAIEACVEDSDGCFFWDFDRNCDPGQTCDDSGEEAVCVGCEDQCDDEGEMRCDRDVVQECAVQENGCLDWEDVIDCGDEEPEQFCVEEDGEAECSLICEDNCDDEGDTRCEDNDVEVCAMQDSGCLDWELDEECGEDETCEVEDDEAMCVSSCEDECDEGESRCTGDVVEVCGEGDSGCLEWQEDTDCSTLEPPQFCAVVDEEATCVEAMAGDSCADPNVVDTFPFTLSGEDFTADFTDMQSLGGADCNERDGSVEAVFAVDLTEGQILLVRELGGLDAVISLLMACGDAEACVFSEDSGEVGGHFYTAEADGRVFVIVEAYSDEPFSTDYSIMMDIGEAEICDDGEDNDLDGLADCDDSDCFGVAPCDEAELNCRDGEDNDGDGAIDCDDDDCTDTFACMPEVGVYEHFEGDGDNFDLVGLSIVYTPDDEAPGLYSYEVSEGSGDFPYEPGDTTLALGDDDDGEYVFTDLPGFELYGTTYTRIFVGSNGYVSFGSGESAIINTLGEFFNNPIVAGLARDLDPSDMGEVTVADSADRVVVTFDGVPVFGSDLPNSFQIVLNADGTIEVHYVTINVGDREVMVGIGAGSGTEEYPDEVDFFMPEPEVCDDDVDNDRDGLTDCDDPDCFGVAPCDAAELNCGDGEDNDGDELADCDDPDCFGVAPCDEAELNCADGEDNDDDGDVDCDDDDCVGTDACLPPHRGVFELFGVTEVVDLMGYSIVFTPDDTVADGYTFETAAAEDFPYAPGGGDASVEIDLGDDDSEEYALSELDGFDFYGETYTSIFISSNGYITFDEGSTAYTASVDGFFDHPIVAGLRRDLAPDDPSTAGDPVITIDDSADRVVVTFQNVPQYSFGEIPGPNDFQMALNADGTIELTYLALEVTSAIVGIGAGPDEDAGGYPDEVDFILTPDEICDDDADNDMDGLADCDDPDCFGVAPCDEAELNCDDEGDNDGDDLTDCEDPDCFGIAPCDVERDCDDDIDNDADGDTDCADDDCADDPACEVPAALVINEVFYDHATPPENREFVELYFSDGAMDLTGYTLAHFASDGTVQWALDLTDLATDDEGFFVVGADAVAEADANWTEFALADTDALLDAAGSALGLYTDWVDGDGELVDAVCWEGAAAGAAPCEGLPSPGIVESAWETSIGRHPDGADTDENSEDFLTAYWVTPGMPNAAPEPDAYTRISGLAGIYDRFPRDIPDNDAGGVRAVINASRVGPESITNVYVGVRITHTFIGDLIITLISPGGATATLHDRSGGGTDDLVAVYDLDTEPAESLDVFNGRSGRGRWTLLVTDNSGMDVGTLDEWVLWFE